MYQLRRHYRQNGKLVNPIKETIEILVAKRGISSGFALFDNVYIYKTEWSFGIHDV